MRAAAAWATAPSVAEASSLASVSVRAASVTVSKAAATCIAFASVFTASTTCVCQQNTVGSEVAAAEAFGLCQVLISSGPEPPHLK